MADTAHSVDSSGEAPSEAVPTLTELSRELFAALRSMLAQSLELASLEARYTGMALSAMLGLAVLLAAGLFSAWGLSLAAAVMFMHAWGWSWSAVLLVAAGANLLLAGLAWWLMRRRACRLGLVHSRRALGLDADHDATN